MDVRQLEVTHECLVSPCDTNVEQSLFLSLVEVHAVQSENCQKHFPIVSRISFT